jgi:hypothetical protein
MMNLTPCPTDFCIQRRLLSKANFNKKYIDRIKTMTSLDTLVPTCSRTIRKGTMDSVTGNVSRDLDVTSFRSPIIVEKELYGQDSIVRNISACNTVSTFNLGVQVITPSNEPVLFIDGFDTIDFGGAVIDGSVVYTGDVTIEGMLNVIGDVMFDKDLILVGELKTCATAALGTLFSSDGLGTMKCFDPTLQAPPAIVGQVLQYDVGEPFGVKWASLAAIGVCTGIHDVTIGTGGATLCPTTPTIGMAGQVLSFNGSGAQTAVDGVLWSGAATGADDTQLLGFDGTGTALPTWRASAGVERNILSVVGGVPSWFANPAGADGILHYDQTGPTLSWSQPTGVFEALYSTDGTSVGWTTLQGAVTTLNALTIGQGAGVAVTGIAPAFAGQLVSYNGVSTQWSATPALNDSQVLGYDMATSLPVWRGAGILAAGNVLTLAPVTLIPTWIAPGGGGSGSILSTMWHPGQVGQVGVASATVITWAAGSSSDAGVNVTPTAMGFIVNVAGTYAITLSVEFIRGAGGGGTRDFTLQLLLGGGAVETDVEYGLSVGDGTTLSITRVVTAAAADVYTSDILIAGGAGTFTTIAGRGAITVYRLA